MPPVAKRILALEESQTIQMAKLARSLKDQGKPIINLSFGEPDFGTPRHIAQAAMDAINEGYTHYTPVAGYPELRSAIARKFKRENGLNYETGQIIVSTGAKQSLFNAMMCLLDPGDEVIIPTPYWVSYSEMVKLAQAKAVYVETNSSSGFKMTEEQLQKALSNNTKLLLFSSPSNPTGAVYSRGELDALVKVLIRYPEVYVLSDEIYEHINYLGQHESIAQSSLKDRVIIVNGVSKAYAMTGWRLGYMAATEKIAAACEKIQSQVTSGTCSITQRAAIAALDGPSSDVESMRKAFERRRDRMFGELTRIPGIETELPSGAFYFFPDVSSYYGGKAGIKGSIDLCNFLLNEANVAVVPGEAFGADQHIRISYAADDDDLITAMQRLTAAFTLLL